MHHYLKAFILFAAVSLHAQTATYSPLMIDKTTAVTAHTNFWPNNSNNLMRIVLTTLNAERVLVVSAATGNDTSAVASPPTTPFLSIGAALSNAPNDSLVVVLPGYYAMTAYYNRPDSVNTDNFTSIPALIRNKTNITVRGSGATITGSGTGCMIGLLNTKDITIEGFKFDLTKGIGEEITNSYIGTICAYGTNVNITVNDIKMYNATDQGVTGSRYEYGFKILNSHFENIGSTNAAYVTNSVGYPYVDGTAISGLGSDTIIANCTFNNNYRDIEWDGVAGNPVHSGLQIIGCTSSNYLHGSIVTYDATTNIAQFQNVSIIGCLFQPSQSENAVNSRDSVLQISGAIWMSAGSNVKIIGNTFENLFDRGIFLSCSSPMENYVISGNTFRGSSLGITNVYNAGIVTVNHLTLNATNLYPLKNITVSGNRFSNMGATAVQLSGANIDINGNSAWDICRSSGGLYGYTIGGSSGCSNVQVRANSYSDSRAASYAHGFAVNNLSKNVFFARDNVARNVDTSLSTSPLSVNAAVYDQVMADGKTFAATLVGGTVTVSYPLIHANSRIQVTRNVTGGTVGHLSVTRVNETSFTVNSSSGTDTSTLAITIFENTF